MATETYPVEASEIQGERFSQAACLVLQAREQVGNGSKYDDFLCEWVGEAVPLSDKFKPVDRISPAGRLYTYNNPHLVRNAYSRGGLMVNYRQASQPTVPGEEAFGFSVATLDLRTNQMVEWHIVSIDQKKTYGQSHTVTRLGLMKPPTAMSIEESNSFLRTSTEDDAPVDAWFISDPQGSYFVADGLWETLEPMDRLVKEVNTLTEDRRLELDKIRERAAGELAHVVTPMFAA